MYGLITEIGRRNDCHRIAGRCSERAGAGSTKRFPQTILGNRYFAMNIDRISKSRFISFIRCDLNQVNIGRAYFFIAIEPTEKTSVVFRKCL